MGSVLSGTGVLLIIATNMYIGLLSYYYLNRCLDVVCQPFLNNYFLNITISTFVFTAGCTMLFRGVWLLQGRPKRIILAAEIIPLLIAVCLFFGSIILGNIAFAGLGPNASLRPQANTTIFYASMLGILALISFIVSVTLNVAILFKRRAYRLHSL